MTKNENFTTHWRTLRVLSAAIYLPPQSHQHRLKTDTIRQNRQENDNWRRAIGDGKVEPNEKQKILELLKNEIHKNIKNDLSIAPEWIRKIMRKVLNPLK